jgi:hypothetical protein
MKTISDNLDTAVLVVFFLMLVYYLLRLHLSEEYKNFDLAQLVTKRDGSADFEKLRVMVAFVSGTYAFFYLLVHDKAGFADYGKWFLLIALGHAVANRVTGREGKGDPQPLQPPQ